MLPSKAAVKALALFSAFVTEASIRIFSVQEFNRSYHWYSFSRKASFWSESSKIKFPTGQPLLNLKLLDDQKYPVECL